MSERPRKSGAWRNGARHLAPALALFFLGSQLLGSADLLLVAHAVCAEHGELIHVQGAAAAGTQHFAPHDASAESYRSTDRGPAHSHDHCLVSTLQREQPVLHKRGTPLPSAASYFVAHVDRLAALLKPGAVLLLAPKTSPPEFRV